MSKSMPLPCPRRNFACLAAVLILQLHSFVVAQTPSEAYRTTNLRISPRWIDATILEFQRQDDFGAWERYRINATTGELSTSAENRSESGGMRAAFRGGPVPRSGPAADSIEIRFSNQTTQSVQMFWVDGSGGRVPYQKITPGQTVRQHTYAGHVWEAVGDDETFYGSTVAIGTATPLIIKTSYPRQKTKRPRKNSSPVPPSLNVRIRDGKLEFRPTSSDAWQDRSPDSAKLDDSSIWVAPSLSPDGSTIAAWLKTDAETLPVWTIESSPKDGGRARLNERAYRLPGDPMDTYELKVINASSGELIPVDVPVVDFGRPKIRWHADNQIIFEKVDRGHQRFRLFVIDPNTQTVRTPIDEESETFIWTIHGPKMPRVTYLDGSGEVLYASEKSGYRHLYLLTLGNDDEMRSVTKGNYLVRSILHVDSKRRFADLVVGEFYDDQDPYHRHLVRVNLDTGKLIAITKGDGDHEQLFSPDRDFVVVSHSRVDSPPVHELRRTNDGELIETLATAKRISPDFNLPIRFTAKGRDGQADIWGLICFPDGYDPESKKAYPVVEYIYAGPHDSHVPKRYRHSAWHREWMDLGFVVVQVDGMGTANRSKAFHDVCWQNLKDAGFPDRIAWMKAAAKKYPALDLSRVGVYGTSAGGQNACGALLFHNDFYKVAMASCGCHDNRMDKSSWNEQWMGYPVGSHYAESSNIDNAGKLEGNLLLLVGELDSNVPPESTLRLVDALIHADKRFDFLMIPGMGHSDGQAYGRQITREFFVRHLKPNGTSSTSETQPNDVREKKTATDLERLPATQRWQLALDLYMSDHARLGRRYPVRISQDHLDQFQHYLDAWSAKLPDLETLSDADFGSTQKLQSQLNEHRSELDAKRQQRSHFLSAYPFTQKLIDLVDVDKRGSPVDFSRVATVVTELTKAVEESLPSASNRENTANSSDSSPNNPVAAELLIAFDRWKRFYAEYNPDFDWWVGDASKNLQGVLTSWAKTVPDSLAAKKSRVTEIEMSDSTEDISPSILGETYPPLEDLLVDAQMPAIMQRFQADMRSLTKNPESTLRRWRRDINNLTLNEKAFPQWCIDDQVDFFRLRQEIEKRLSVASSLASQSVSRSSDGSDLEGVFVGRDRLQTLLDAEFIGHTPEELIALAESEYVACRQEMCNMSREMGLGDDWQAAVERIKNQHVEPGQQPQLIRKTAQESIDWIRNHDLMTVDGLAEHTWRMQMMTPERQRVNPFFTGGEVISVSFPTRDMTPDAQRQSLRGNNLAFARATVHHELIPGHHYQAYQTSRFQQHRRRFSTPFWLEGWAVYWEFILYEGGFARTPEEKLGFLVWRAHRYARIIFSLRFHLGQFSPDQCVQFLIDNVGFDRRNATAEVRRSIGSSYPPLYQAAYMLGAMQFRQLAKEWVERDRGTKKSFHDAVMKLGSMPIALLRARLFEELLQRNKPPIWRFDLGEVFN